MIYTNKKQLIKLLSYMSTFDGGLYISKGADNAQFIMNMREENKDYMEWVKSTLEQVTSARLTKRPDYNVDGYNRQPQLRLESRRHPLLTTLRDRIYIDKTKVIDPHMLKLMDAEALAIMFMADGGSYLDTRSKTPHCNICLHTKGFSYNDNLALSKAIYSATGVVTNVHRQNKYYYLSVVTKSKVLFVKTILPYVKESFLYKLEKIAPAMGEDIVRSLQECKEKFRNEISK